MLSVLYLYTRQYNFSEQLVKKHWKIYQITTNINNEIQSNLFELRPVYTKWGISEWGLIL